jgi:uncharacterized membrane protein
MSLFGSKTVEKVVEKGTVVAKTFSSKEQGTRRQQNDMLSDSWLSKNIRPIISLWVLLLFSIFLIVKACGISLDREIGGDIAMMAFIVFSFYFPGRSLEKWIKSKTQK